MSYDTRLLTSHLMFEFTTLFCTIDDFFQKNEAVYWQYLKKDNLGTQGVELMTYHRKSMRPVQISSEDEAMLRQRNKIETIFSLLKQQYN